jgi:hypothetical protein
VARVIKGQGCGGPLDEGGGIRAELSLLKMTAWTNGPPPPAPYPLATSRHLRPASYPVVTCVPHHIRASCAPRAAASPDRGRRRGHRLLPGRGESGGGHQPGAAAGGAPRARSHCRFLLPLIHFIPYSRTDSVSLSPRRQCDRTLGAPGLCARLPRLRSPRLRLRRPQARAPRRARARSPCRSAPPLIRCMPDSLRDSAPLFLSRRCGRALRRALRLSGPAPPARPTTAPRRGGRAQVSERGEDWLGMGVTIVDSLDTMLLMGLRSRGP